MAEDFSLKEENRLYFISGMVAVIVFTILISYYGFVHLATIPPGTPLMLDSLLNLFLPVMVAMPATFCLTYEVLTSRTRTPMQLHVKRFLGRMTIVFIGGTLFILVYLASYFFLAPFISERFAILSSLLILLAILTVSVAKYTDFFDKLEKGKW